MDQELLVLHNRIDHLHKARLDAVRTGEARGEALIDQRRWRLSRDECGLDRSCIQKSYLLREAALYEFSGETNPVAFTIKSIQQELNRLSCGAGSADGVIGQRTTNAYALAVSLSETLEREASLESPETLKRLRSLGSGLCSFISRASLQPRLLEGVWNVEFLSCPSGTVELSARRFRLLHDGAGVYSGLMGYGTDGDFTRAVGGRVTEHSFTIVHETDSGARQVFSFEPAESPDVFSGYSHIRCSMRATR